jgi:hypothetical protein
MQKMSLEELEVYSRLYFDIENKIWGENNDLERKIGYWSKSNRTSECR